MTSYFFSFGEYKLIKDSYDCDFTTWQSVSALKTCLILSARWQMETSEGSHLLGVFKPLFDTGSIFGQCKLLPPVYVYDIDNFQLNIRRCTLEKKW